MATVYRGLKSRVAGALWGLLLASVGVGFYLAVGLPAGRVDPLAGQVAPKVAAVVGFVAVFVLFGVYNVGKALFQSDYRIVVNVHRGSVSVRFGRRLGRW